FFVNNKINSKLFISMFLFLAFFLMNFYQPLIADDLYNGAIAPLYNHIILANLLNYYHHWTGRISSIYLEELFFNAPYEKISILIFNMLNSLGFVLLYNFIYNILNKNQYTIGSYLFFIFGFTLFLQSTLFLGNAIWKTAALTYFWGIVL